MKLFVTALSIISFSILLVSCSTSGPSGLFGKKSPHEQYGDKLKDAGLNATAMGQKWFSSAQRSLDSPLNISLPYSETGYFAAANPSATGLLFNAKRGQKLQINLSKNPETGFTIYLDLWQPLNSNDGKLKLLASADTTNYSLEYEVSQAGNYQLRLQPELLKSGEYTLTITTGPSLAFPVSPKNKSRIGSFWGDGRDNGERRHEGIDIFAPKRTPLVAAANGVVTRVNENNLGGKVVFMRPSGKEYSLYYAHLDEQIATAGQQVKMGDTIGLVGNTGNASTTAPHLHFGIYTSSGAVDPLPYIDPEIKKPAQITASIFRLDQLVRTTVNTNLYNHPSKRSGTSTSLKSNSVLYVKAATAGWYKVLLPDNHVGFIDADVVKPLDKIKTIQLVDNMPLLDAPEPYAPKILILKKGESVNVLGSFEQYSFVSDKNNMGWVRL